MTLIELIQLSGSTPLHLILRMAKDLGWDMQDLVGELRDLIKKERIQITKVRGLTIYSVGSNNEAKMNSQIDDGVHEELFNAFHGAEFSVTNAMNVVADLTRDELRDSIERLVEAGRCKLIKRKKYMGNSYGVYSIK